jgi:hypothetical protein
MYRFTIYESGASYGAQLQNLKYRNEMQHWGGCVKLNISYDAIDCLLLDTQRLD